MKVCSAVSFYTRDDGINIKSKVLVSLNSMSTTDSISFSLRPFLLFFASFSCSLFLASSSSDVSNNDDVNYDCIEREVLSLSAVVPLAPVPSAAPYPVALASF